MGKPKLLLSSCCAPCSTYPVEKLGSMYQIILHFYGSNIHPEEEYRNRKESLILFAEKLELPLIADEYCPEKWFKAIKGLEDEIEGGKRCLVCYRLRLESVAQLAIREGANVFTTTLTTGPQKKADVINRIGKEVADKYRLEFIPEDFKKKEGFKRSCELSKKYGLYRQNYCGCIFSLKGPNIKNGRAWVMEDKNGT